MNPINHLQEYCMKVKIDMPTYDLVNYETHPNSHIFTIRVTIGPLKAEGVGSNKKKAKWKAAENMRLLIPNDSTFNTSSISSSPGSSNTSFDKNDSDVSSLKIDDNYIGKLQEFCVKHQLNTPVYDWYPGGDTGFRLTCRVKNFSEEAIASNKKGAKHACAKKMYQRLTQIDDKLKNTQQNLNENNSPNTSLTWSSAFEKLYSDKALAVSSYQLSIEKARSVFSSHSKGTISHYNEISLNDYHSYLKNSLTPNTLIDINNYLNKLRLEKNHEVKIYEKNLKEICLLLNVDFEENILLSKTKQVIIAYTINTNPSYTGIGIGSYYEIAKLNALLDSINVIREILQ